MLIGALPINYFGCGYYRVLIPLRNMEMRESGIKSRILRTSALNQISNEEYPQLMEFVDGVDILLVQRRTGSHWEHFVENMQRKGKRIVYELDDSYEGIPPENLKLNSKYMCHHETRSSVAKMCRMADIVTVSTPELAEWTSKFCSKDKIRVLKNTLDFTMWPAPHYGEKPEKDPLIVGFAGAESHRSDLPELGASLEILNRKYNVYDKTSVLFSFMGFMLEDFWKLSPHVGFSEGVPFLDYPTKLATRKFDVGLAPLKPCFFNQCKSELRYLENAALGVPIVATDIAPFRRAITPDRGILVKNKSSKWANAIDSLLQDKAKRGEMGRNAYEHVIRKYNIVFYVNNWLQVYQNL